MNENRHPIDDLFRDGLDQYSVEPPMHVWERIDQTRTPVYKLINNFKQNARWYMSLAAGLVLISSAAILILKDGKIDDHALSQTQAVNEAPAPEAPSGSAGKSEEAPSITDLQAENQSFQSEASTNQLPATTNPFRAELPTRASNATPQNRASEETPQEMAPQEEPSKTELAQNGTNVTPPKEQEKVDVPEQMENNEQIVEEVQGEEIPEVTEDPLVKSSEEANDPQPEKAQQPVVNPPITPSPWSVEILGSYDFVNRHFQGGNPAYRNARNKYEKVGAAYTFQMRAEYRFNRILSVRSGLSFSQIHENLNFNYTSPDQINVYQKTGYIIDPINGPQKITYEVKDTMPGSTTTFRSSNSYTFLDIPILLNYHMYTTNKWDLGLSGGPVFNLAFRQRGQIVNPSVTDVIKLNGASNPYKGYAGLNVMFNLTASYKLDKHFDLLFEPGLRFGVTSLTNSSFGMTQKYNSYNLFTGVRYNF
ncbi:MAG: outer membrane beta-barrel protein [Bacteroidetes bacterium]|nr:outer membrane beta-barrel protein [Bacteroidota bacterium]